MKNEKTLVSVIIPTYGRPDYLPKAIDSVIKQTYKNIEILVIDDNDNFKFHIETMLSIKTYIDNKKIKYIYDGSNCGGAIARNKGIHASKGELITFLDDDDVYLENKISNQLEHIRKYNLDVSVCDMFYFNKNKMIDIRNCYARVDNISDFLLDGNSFTPMIMCRKDFLLKVNCFTNSPRYQDHILMLKFFEHNAKVKHLNEKLFIHNNHTGTRITFSDKSIQAYNIRKEYEEKLLDRVSKEDRLKYLFKTALINAKIERRNGFFPSMKILIKLLSKIKSISDLVSIVKTAIRIIFFPKKNL